MKTEEPIRLGDKYARLLRPGDKLTLDTEGAPSYIGTMRRNRLKESGLIDGGTYVYVANKPIYKPGECTIVGHDIVVKEAAEGKPVFAEYFVIDGDLEMQLKARKAQARH